MGRDPLSIRSPAPFRCTASLRRSACSPFCEPGLDQAPDQTPIALCKREFIRKASFQKYADTVMTCKVSCGHEDLMPMLSR